MKKAKIILPPLGEGIIEATLMQWLKKKGDSIETDEPIAEIATDKVDTEVLSPLPGIIDRFFYKEGDTPKVGDVIAVINVDNSVAVPEHLLLTDFDDGTEKSTPKTTTTQEPDQISKNVESVKGSKTSEMWLSPLVRSIMTAENIPEAEIKNISGSGLHGRITRDDIINYLKNRNYIQQPQNETFAVTQSDFNLTDDLILPMSRMRTIIAERMVQSVATSPHVTSFVEVDITNIVNWRNRIKPEFEKKYGERLTFTPIFVEAMVEAIRQYPMINVSVQEKNIVLHKRINIGMATALPSGDLIVPVIKNADEKNLLGLVRSINDLSERARNNQLKPDEIKGGTFTFTNVGTFNNLTGTPIINQPEVAILAIGAIKKRPAVIETPQGDTIGIRHMVILSLSYDHRVVDGALGGMFLAKVAQLLEQFDQNRNI
ncbi:MAG TPA: dihydrolipoamide acetyltransferase family protein [Salinivirgaceae bacterium]|nr:dihydrolipoamide acetyltransferase family protein [Salinivirgaceae bacterium]